MECNLTAVWAEMITGGGQVDYNKVTNFYRYTCLQFWGFTHFTGSTFCYSTPFNEFHDGFFIP